MVAELMIALVVALPGGAGETDPNEAVLEALQEIQSLVGQWEGSGKSDASKGWDESIACQWKFGKNGKISLYFTFSAPEGKSAGRLLDEAMITYDPEKKVYILRAYKATESSEAEVLEFEGKPKSATNLVFERVGSADDSLDRLDLKLLNDGDRVVYAFHRRVGKSKTFRPYAQVGLDRQGTSIAGAAANGPKCIVTGGPGTIPVSYEGSTYFVCCTGCRDAFLADPKRYLAKAEGKR